MTEINSLTGKKEELTSLEFILYLRKVYVNVYISNFNCGNSQSNNNVITKLQLFVPLIINYNLFFIDI